MRSILYLCSFLAVCFTLYAEIIETKQFNKITEYIDSETLVLLDIDDTLLIPVQTLGTDVWFCYKLNKYQKEEPLVALDKALAEWEAVRHITQVKIVEDGTQDIIKKLQNDQVVVMGLTTQGLALATRTVNQLGNLHIDLSKTAPSPDDHYFMNQRGVLYRHGILFTAGTVKGEALLKFLDLIAYSPKHIIFINDKKTHLEDVEKSVGARGIKFTGLRYSYSDERVANFCPKIAEIQWNNSSFNRLISDEEAKLLLNAIN